jgi:glycosyltransferase involved in cell wall biosynthesis
MQPIVSIIIPYNVDRGYLFEAIHSVNTQTYKGEIQLIMAHSPNTVGYNINEGLRKATGKYVKYFAEDDWLEPTCIEESVNFLESTPHRWMHSNSHVIQWDGNRKGARSMHIPPFNPSMAHMLHHNYIHGGTVMYERSLFDEVGGFDEDLRTGEEYEFYLRLYDKGILPGYLDSFTFNYRMHSKQKSLGNKDVQYQAWRREVVESIKNRYR